MVFYTENVLSSFREEFNTKLMSFCTFKVYPAKLVAIFNLSAPYCLYLVSIEHIFSFLHSVLSSFRKINLWLFCIFKLHISGEYPTILDALFYLITCYSKTYNKNRFNLIECLWQLFRFFNHYQAKSEVLS